MNEKSDVGRLKSEAVELRSTGQAVFGAEGSSVRHPTSDIRPLEKSREA